MERNQTENGFTASAMLSDTPTMFRLIAIALTSTFLLLALFGTSGEQTRAQHPARVMGIMGTLVTVPPEAPDVHRHYVSRHHQPMKTAPDPGAGVLRILPFGTVVEVIDAGHGNFTQIRDPSGEIGFVHAASLSDSFPG